MLIKYVVVKKLLQGEAGDVVLKQKIPNMCMVNIFNGEYESKIKSIQTMTKTAQDS